MTSPESIALILRARAGDRQAMEDILKRYYPAWLRKVQAIIGKDLRALSAPEDLLQSAIADALRGLERLDSEAAFFCWVFGFCQNKLKKLAEKRRKFRRTPSAAAGEGTEPAAEDRRFDQFATEDEYVKVLDAILDLFPTNPEHMGALYLHFIEGTDIAELMQIFEWKRSNVYLYLNTAKKLVRSKLHPTMSTLA